MTFWTALVAILVAGVIVAAIFGYGPGRYEIVEWADPGEYHNFWLLDTRTGQVFLCDRTGCLSEPLNP